MVFQNNLLAGASGATGAQAPFDTTLIGNSIWLDGSADNLTKSFGSGADQQEFVLAAWVQRNLFGSLQFFFGSGTSGRQFGLGFTASDQLELRDFDSPVNARYITNALFRDIGWYHVLTSIKTSESAANNRVKIFVNGSEITSFSTETNPSLNFDMNWGISGDTHAIGSFFEGSASNYFKGYITQAVYISGKSIQGGDFTISDFLDTFTFGTNGSQFIPKKDSDIASLATGGGATSFCLDFSSASVALSSGVTPTSNAGTVSGSLSNLTDGNFTNDWRSNVDPATNVDNDHVAFDLGSAKDVKAVKVTSRGSITGNFKVQFSDNGSDFTDTGTTFSNVSITTTANSGILDLTSDNPGSHRYWKLINISNSSGTSGWGFREIILASAVDYLGTDASGKGNDFTLTSIGSNNQSSNTPSLAYPLLNPLSAAFSTPLSNGNTIASGSSGNGDDINPGIIIPKTGKWVWQITNTTDADLIYGVRNFSDMKAANYSYTNLYGFYSHNGTLVQGASPSGSYLDAASGGDVYQIYYNAETRKMWVSDNGTIPNSGDPDGGTNEAFTIPDSGFDLCPTALVGSSAPNSTFDFGMDGVSLHANGQTFKPLTSNNLPTPDFQGIDYFNAVKYTGNGTAIGSGGKAVTGTGFKPDWVWIKNRDAADSHALYDVVRGTTKQIESDNTSAETTESEGLTTFGSDGFTVGNLDQVNTNTENYVAWQWLGSNSTSTNTNGSLNTTVTTADAGHFSVVSWTGNETLGATIGHGMGGEPEFIIAIARAESGENKPVYHKFMTADTNHLKINEASAQGTAGTTIWDVSAMSSTLIGLGAAVQSNSNNGMIAYCFRSIPGVCKVGKYIPNNVIDGPYIGLGFTPAMIFLKCINTTNPWMIFDNTRDVDNPVVRYLHPNSNAVEAGVSSGTGRDIDFLSDGFKIRENDSDINGGTSNTYLFVAMADIGGNGTLPPIYGR